MFPLSSVIVAVALAKSTFAAVAFTSPTATIGFTGGQNAAITWMDDGKEPAMTAYGPCKLSIYAGNAQLQTSLQLITGSIDPSTTTTFSFIPDQTIGPDSGEYFIRLESLNNHDNSTPPIPLLAFSHTFNMTGMTGTFSPEVQSEIDGQSTAPIGGGAPTAPAPAPTPSAAPNAAPSASVVGNTAKPSVASSGLPKTSAGGSGSATAKGAAASGKSAAVPNFVASHNLWLGVVAGVVGAFMGATLL